MMAKAATISFKEFRTRYHTEEACREELFRQRFPKGFVCPKCGCKVFLCHSQPERLPVPFLPSPDLRHCRNDDAPHPSALDRLVLGDLSLRHR